MTRLKLIGGILVVFGILAALAWLGYPTREVDGTVGRKVMVLDFLVRTIATDNFGNVGGAVFYAVLGVAFAAVVLFLGRSTTGNKARQIQTLPCGKRHREEPATTAKTERRRSLSGLTGTASDPALTGIETVPKSEPWDELAEIEEALDHLPSIAADTAQEDVPAWGLMLASPWADEAQYTSWLGGLPCAPSGFAWPRDSEDGEPMHFYAQIDLASLTPEPETGRRAPGLPERGAILVFIGSKCAVRVLDAEQMADADIVPPPHDLPDLQKFGYWDDGNTFPVWPIKPQAFLAHPYDEDAYWEENDGDGRPEAFPNPHRKPADWITNWGMAALDARITTKALQADLDNAERQAERQGRESMVGYSGLLLEEAPKLLERLEKWQAWAEASDPTTPVDMKALEDIFEQRVKFCNKVQANYSGTIALRGAPYKVWQEIWSAFRSDNPFTKLRTIEAAYRPFAEQWITDWRHHRLFGIEPPFSNNWEDLRGKACLISIGADPLLKTETEHEYGLSLWGPAEDLQTGLYDRLEIVRHCAV